MRAMPIGCALRRATRERFARGAVEPAVRETRVPPNRARDVTRFMTLFLFAIVLLIFARVVQTRQRRGGCGRTYYTGMYISTAEAAIILLCSIRFYSWQLWRLSSYPKYVIFHAKFVPIHFNLSTYNYRLMFLVLTLCSEITKTTRIL